VKVKNIQKEYKFDENNYFRDGYYFEANLVGELIALFSVFFQARFFLKAQISGELTPSSIKSRFEKQFYYKKPHPFINFEMFDNQSSNWANEEGLADFLNIMLKLNEGLHQNIIRACYWYSEAIKEIGSDHQMFFIKMVSAIESLLNYIQIASDGLEKKIIRITENHDFTVDEISQIHNWLNVRRVRYKFKIFLKRYSYGFFRGGNRKAKHCYILKRDLGKYANRIYDARSKYLHRGEPMYISFDTKMVEAKYWDLDPTKGMLIDRRKISESKKLPRVRWFERLVNHCLLNFFDEQLKIDT